MHGRIISTLLVVFFLCLGSLSAQGQDKKPSSAIVVAPFDIGAPGKYSYLKDSLRNMLASRLAARDGVRILDFSLSQKELDEVKSSKKQDPVKGLFARLQADYLASGVLYSTANGLNLQVTLYSASSSGNPIKFAMLAENDEKIMSSLDQLAQEIGDKVSGTNGPQEKAKEAVSEDGRTQQAPSVSEGSAGFQTAHPDRLYRKGIYAGGAIVGGENAGSLVSSQGARKSAPLSMQMVTMAVGDLDGDGVEEIVCATDGELRFYHFREGRFAQIAKAPISQRLKIHAMNLADLDGNRKMEIYISATDENTLSSLIAEWDKTHGLQILHKNIRWYIRPLDIPGEGVVLTGQEKGPEDSILVFPGIHRLTMEKGRDIPKKEKQLSMPDSVNLFDFVLADLNGDGAVEKIVIDKNEKMLVYDQNNNLLWVSNDEFGGSKNYIGPRWQGTNIAKGRVFVPTRIIAADVNNDKKQDIIIGRNKRDTYSFFSNLRSYSGGFISCLTWTGSEMSELWHTNMLPGLIADYSFEWGHVEKVQRTKAGQAVEKAEPGKKSAALFLGQIPESTVYNVLIPAKEETVLFSYQLDFMGESGTKK